MISVERDRAEVAVTRIHLPQAQQVHVVYGDLTDFRDIAESALEYDRHVQIHSLHVNRAAFWWSQVLDLTEEERHVFTVAALLHDLGKRRVPAAVVSKPEELTPHEWVLMKEHVWHGVAMLEDGASDFRLRVADVIGQHHERVDGDGYPLRLQGNEIDKIARMLSVVDAFSAMVDDRPYRQGMSVEDALEIIADCAGTQFDAQYASSFIAFRRLWNDSELYHHKREAMTS